MGRTRQGGVGVGKERYEECEWVKDGEEGGRSASG